MSISTNIGAAAHNLFNALPLSRAKPVTKSRSSRRVAADTIGFLDMAAVVIGGLVPSEIYTLSGPGVITGRVAAVQWALVVAIMVYGALRHFNLYDTSKMHDFPVAPGKLLLALGIAFAAVLGIGLPFTASEPHLWIWYGAWMSTSFTLLLGNRIVANKVLARMTAAGAFDTRVAVYGAGNIAARLDKYLRNPALGIYFAGVFDDRSDEKRSTSEGPAPAGRLDDLVMAGRAGKIDQIIIALPQAADHRTADIAAKLEQLPVSLHVCTHIASDLVDEGAAKSVSRLGPVGLLDIKQKPLSDWAPRVKAAEDYVLGALLLIVSLPLLALAALAIKIEGNGPVLFRQRRRGLNREVFEVLKLRTMDVMEDGDDVRQATRGDARTTRVGRMLRRTSIDELPQLVNVLRGEMSLVGPRPHALVHDEKYSELLQTYANRHQVKPGMTGWAQVNGCRGETSTAEQMQKRLDYDLAYINGWSFGFDMAILGKTLVKVVLNKDVY